jgi:type IV secretion system protein VirB4
MTSTRCSVARGWRVSNSAHSSSRREHDPHGALPYGRHVTGQVVALDTQSLMMSFQLDGAAFETADVGDLNDWHIKLNAAWRNLADDRLAIWHHLVRRQHSGYPQGAFRSAFAADLDQKYRLRLEGRRMFVNQLYITLVLHPGREGASRASAWFSKAAKAGVADPAEDGRLKRLEDAGRDLGQYLARYGVRPLGLYQSAGQWFSEPMELLHLVLTGRSKPAPLVRGHLGSSIYDARLIFEREVLEIREAAETRFAAILGIKEYPALTRPGLWNGLLAARFPLVAAQSFSFLSKAAARAVMERKQNQSFRLVTGRPPKSRAWAMPWTI